MKIDLVPLEAHHLRDFNDGQPPRMTVRGIAAVRDDGQVLGIAGFHQLPARVMVFSELKPECFAHRRLILRAARALLAMVRSTGMPAIAVPDPTIETAPRFLRHLGFVEFRQGGFEWRS